MRKLFLLLIFLFAMSIPCFAASAEQSNAFDDGVAIKYDINADKLKVRVSENENMTYATEATYQAGGEFYVWNLKGNEKYFLEIQGIKDGVPTEKVKTVAYTKYGDTRPITVTLNGNYPSIKSAVDENGNNVKPYTQIIRFPEMYKVGKHELKVEFTGKYSGKKPVTVPYTILPDTPDVKVFSTGKTSVNLWRQSWSGTKTPITVRYSTRSDMTDAKTANMGTETHYVLNGLKKATTYYIECYATENGSRSKTTNLKTFTYGDAPDSKYIKMVISRIKSSKGKTVTLPYPIGITDFYNTFDGLQNAYPMYFKAKKYSPVENGTSVYAISFKPASSSAVKKAKAEEKAIAGYLKGAKKKKGTKAKLWYINERMAKKCHYDYPAYSFYRKHGSIGKYSYAWKSYGILVKHKGVCESYTRAYNAVANRLGIEAKYYGSSKMNHAWSKVKVGKKWYFVDATWSDCGKKCTKQYFLKRKMHGVRI